MKTEISPHHPSSNGSRKPLISNPGAKNFDYTGSKGAAGVFQRIIGQMPAHPLYIEPFFGSGQVYWRKKSAPASIVMDLRSDLLTAAASQPGTVTVQGNAIEKLALLKSALPADTVIYCDPPYLLSTRKEGRRYYQPRFPGDVDAEMTDEQHGELLELLNSLNCRVMLSGYPSDLYSCHLRNWRCESYRTRTHKRTVTECLWCNFPEPAFLHDWRYAGKSHRQRVTLKRLAARYLKRLEAMPDRKRGYVLNAIEQRQNWQQATPGHTASALDLITSALAWQASSSVTGKVAAANHGCFIGRCFLGQLELFKTGQRDSEFQAVLDCQDWALRHGKQLRFV